MKISRLVYRFLFSLVAFILLIGASPLVAIDTFAATLNFAGGSGTETDPYLIATKEHLNNVRNDLGAHYRLITDIVFTEEDFAVDGSFYNNGCGWSPIGASESSFFYGTFDGNEYTISGLYLNITSSEHATAGLFGYSRGIIKNLTLEAATIIGSVAKRAYFGGIAGWQSSGGIYNCAVSVDITIESSAEDWAPSVGGVVGYAESNTVISGCRNNGVVMLQASNAPYANVGGIVGRVGTSSSLIDCHNSGCIEGGEYTGGIAGYSYNTAISNCSNSGILSGTYNTGGICGYVFYGTLSNCYNVGEVLSASNVTASSSYAYSYAGGIVGDSSTCTITNCYNAGIIKSTVVSSVDHARAGGIAGQTSGTIQTCYNVGSVLSEGYAAGICGYINSSNGGSIVACYYVDSCHQGVHGVSDTTVKYTVDMMVNKSKYIQFDFVGTWTIDPSSAYPFPRLLSNEHSDTNGSIEDTAKFAGGNGSMEDPYKIATKDHLNNVRGFSSSGQWFVLVADIAFDDSDFAEGGAYYNGGQGWQPIGTDSSTPFVGVFDGNNHTISGVYENAESESNLYVGLFGYCQGTIRNLKLTNLNISGTVTGETSVLYAGGICGYLSSGAINNCSTAGEIIANETCVSSIDKATVVAGGIVGESSFSDITKCANYANVTAYAKSKSGGGTYIGTWAKAGGIAGKTTGSISNSSNMGKIIADATNQATSSAGGITARSEGNISTCYNTGSVQALGNPNNDAAGIAAYYSTGTISNCYNVGSIRSAGDIGGAVSYLSSGTINNFYNVGSLSWQMSWSNAGGVVGYAAKGNITNCYFLETTIGLGIGRGTGNTTRCTAADMALSSTFTGFKFSSVWTMGGNGDYVYPELVSNEFRVVLNSIQIKAMPSKVEYLERIDDLDVSGGYIYLKYNSGLTEQIPITKDMVSGFDNTKVGPQTLSVIFNGKTCTYEITVIAVEYNVTFLNHDGSVISTATYYWGDKITVPTDPSKPADNTYTYAFAGWDKPVVDCDGNAIYTAIYSSTYINYTVVFKDWDGTVLSTKTYHWGDKVTEPANPTKVADNTYTYAFKGWDKTVASCAGDVTYIATYTSTYIDYTIVFKNWDGTVLSTTTYHYGDVVTAPTNPTKAADNTYTYTFKGWDAEIVNCVGHTVYTAQFDRQRKDGILYFIEDGQVTITGYAGNGGSVLIPETIEGLPVTNIGASAFFNCTNLISVSIPGSVTSIGNYAFTNCTYLTSITIPDNVTSIGVSAFANCTYLTSAKLGNRISIIERCTFLGCYNLASINIPEGVTCIGDSAFYNTSLESINIPSSVISIGSDAFGNCIDLVYVYVTDPSAWCKIAFNNKFANPLFYSAALRVVDSEGNKMTEIALDCSVTNIPAYAFKGCTDLTNIVIPNGVTSIGDSAFYNCTKLVSIDIPDSVTSIGDSAFYNCGLNAVFYRGSQTESNNVSVDSGNGALTRAEWHYEVTNAVFADQNCYYCAECNSYFLPDGSEALATIIFKDWDGIVISTKKLPYNASVPTITNLYRPHDQPNIYQYIFTGWDKDVVNCTGNATYTAVYQEIYIDYTVVFKDWNGTILSTKTYHWGDNVTAPVTPTRTADNTYTYTFLGWDNEIVSCSGDATYTAIYTATHINYTVVFKDWNGTVLSSKTYHYGDVVTAPANPNRAADNTYTYTFSGWDNEIVSCSGEATYTATYTSTYIDYAVVFKDWNGTILSTKTYHWGDKVTAPADPSKTADNTYTYVFAGWDTAVLDCVGNATYTATYTSAYIDYTVVFKNWDGTVLSTKTYHWDEAVTVPTNPTKATDYIGSYSFAGWDVEIATFCNGNAIYTAIYTTTYTDYIVAFKNWDGSEISAMTYHYGDAITVPANPARPDDDTYVYTFTGWDKTVVACNGDAVYTAVYSKVTRVPSVITSPTYTISNGTISKIATGTTVDALLGKLNEGEYVKVYNGTTEVAKDTLIGTGMVVKIMDGDTEKVSVTVVVTGDTNGDGKITVTDYVQLKSHLLNKSTLTGAAAQAADTSGDGKATVTDYVQIKAHILGKSSVEPKSVTTVPTKQVRTLTRGAEVPLAAEVPETTATVVVIDVLLPEKKTVFSV